MKKILIIIIALVCGVGAFYGYNYFQKQQKISSINSYEQCAAAGFPILTSYPGQCKLPNGKSFTEDIGNELEFSNEILIENPRPNQKIELPFVVKGKARGNWFFEAVFSGELLDENNVVIGNVVLSAEGEWMTEEFVPFRGELKFEEPTTAKGKLVLKNANPSGIAENEKTLTIPVRFK